MSEATDSKVDAYLLSIGVTYRAIHLGLRVDDAKWQHDAWNVSFERGGKILGGTDYKTGIGHRGKPKGYVAESIRKRYGRLATNHREWVEACPVVKPSAAGVIHSMILDGSAISMSFQDWCDNYGCDTDSRKAMRTYESCQKVGDLYNKIFKPTERSALEELLADY